ncbi:HD domain-containing phosphohydrolase [Undibacterium sp. SXout11W]|uniref:HD domain-containing phosphohydrolase n=1 Tax=Undibacterium sp. SXout11W TaxID=3413050 RepID=UPI003BEF52D5
MQASKKLPFQIYISFCLAGLVVALVIVIAQFNQMGQIILHEANRDYERTGRQVAKDVQAIYTPARNQTEILAEAMPIPGDTLDERLEHLAYLAKSISSVPSATSSFIGYADGEFFLLRKYDKNSSKKSLFNVPDDTAWIVQSTSLKRKKLVEHIVSFNTKLEETSRQKIPRRNFEPRETLWYKAAMAAPGKINVTKPYYFYTNHQIGVTYSQKIDDTDAVVGIDIELPTILQTIENSGLTPSSRIALLGENAQILAMVHGNQVPFRPEIITEKDGTHRMPNLMEQDAPILNTVFKLESAQDVFSQSIDIDGESWATFKQHIETPGGGPLTLLIASPHKELLEEIIAMKKQSMLIFGLLFALAFLITVSFSKRVTAPIIKLAEEANKIAHFDFQSTVEIDSAIKEISELASSMQGMKATIQSFLGIARDLAGETNFDRLLASVLRELSEITIADTAVLYLYEPKKSTLESAQVYMDHEVADVAQQIIPITQQHPVAQVCHSESSVMRLSVDELKEYFGVIAEYQHDCTLIAIPLRDRNNQLVGAIALLINASNIDIGRHSMAVAVSGTAAIAIENQRLIQEQKALLEAFIQLLAGAIDAKSPYTGGHCQRVPILTKSLARAACNETSGTFADFRLSEAEWEELHIAAWLHDCGKVTTPEYIVDKATKLETLYDRIHEVRMRFEVIKRDVQIDYWKAIAEGGDPEKLRQQRDQAIATIDNDFAFVAECNVGGEFMSEEKIERLDNIAERKWQRSLSDRIGISSLEKERKDQTPEPLLPVMEKLLDDKPEHIFIREEQDKIAPDNPWGFNIKVPEHLYNRGELYNLRVKRGTLSEEERYKINEHMVQTIKMLTQLPFPRHLSRVPEIAGGHHEKLDGTGYPKGLHDKDMQAPEKMMAIADIFEALTASDRPYKKGKTLSETLKIMNFMKQDQHIDADLFAVFLRSGVYLEYAHQYLSPEQIDEADIHAYI